MSKKILASLIFVTFSAVPSSHLLAQETTSSSQEQEALKNLIRARTKAKENPKLIESNNSTAPATPHNVDQARTKATPTSDEDASNISNIPDSAIEIYANGYLEARDEEADKMREKIKAAQQRRRLPANYQEATEDLKKSEDKLKRIMAHKEPLWAAAGSILFQCGFLVCVQKLDATTAFVRSDRPILAVHSTIPGQPSIYEKDPKVFFVDGIDTTNFVDDGVLPEKFTRNKNLMLLLDGTKSYIDALNTKRTVSRAILINLQLLHDAAMKKLRLEKKIPK